MTDDKDLIARLRNTNLSDYLRNAFEAADRLEALTTTSAESVAEVVWHEPAFYEHPLLAKGSKIIDGSLAFMDTAPLGTKLYAHPDPRVATLEAECEQLKNIARSHLDRVAELEAKVRELETKKAEVTKDWIDAEKRYTEGQGRIVTLQKRIAELEA